MPRADQSKFVVHWTSGNDDQSAFDCLNNIIAERKIRGSSNCIRGNWTCVCFTEAPENTFHQVTSKYRPFGIQVPKSYLFGIGGRPVIYQSNAEYDRLPENFQWRHVKYEPDATPPFDFSWEREWRILANELVLDPENFRILVPDQQWADILIDVHAEYEEHRIQFMASVYGDEYLSAEPEPFAYSYAVINPA